MLSELSIRHFGIITSIDLSFQQGLTVITGETGTGKSMIIDAIHLLIGGRGAADFVRHGEKKAKLEGLFLIEKYHPCRQKMADLGILVEDGMVVLQRVISNQGKSVCRLNGNLVPLSVLKDIGRTLVDIHGQHEHQELLQPEKHLPLLDQFAGEAAQPVLKRYQKLFKSYKDMQKTLEQLAKDEKDTAQRLDLLSFQINEIETASLKPDEDEQLENEKSRLTHFEKVHEALQTAYYALNDEQKGLDWTRQAARALEHITDVDDAYRQMHESLADHYYQLEEISFTLRDTYDQLSYDPKRLNDIEERLHEIEALKRKYGSSVAEILQFCKQAASELETLAHRDEQITEIKQKLTQLQDVLLETAKELSARRKTAAKKLITAMVKELQDLYMEKTQFDVEFEKNKDEQGFHFQHNGIDRVYLLISTNPGEPLKPLAKVASGGELSRIMLAMKCIFSTGVGTMSVIFDEVDTGVSGRVAQSMAEKIVQLSVDSQVFCITHLPQVAAMADTHLLITKTEKGNRTEASVSILSKTEKIDEIGRMISGVEMTDLTKRHAKELLELASDIKTTS